MKVVCREAGITDHAGITKLSRGVYDGTDYTPSIFPVWIDDKDWHIYVAETLLGEIIGFTALNRTDEGASIVVRSSRVAESYRGKGIYAMLLSSAFASVGTKSPEIKFVLEMRYAKSKPTENSDIVGRIARIVMLCDLRSETSKEILRPMRMNNQQYEQTPNTFSSLYDNDSSFRSLFYQNVIIIGDDIMHAGFPDTRQYLDKKEALEFRFTKSENEEGDELVFSVLNLSSKEDQLGNLVFELNLYGNGMCMMKYHVLQTFNAIMQHAGGNFSIVISFDIKHQQELMKFFEKELEFCKIYLNDSMEIWKSEFTK